MYYCHFFNRARAYLADNHYKFFMVITKGCKCSFKKEIQITENLMVINDLTAVLEALIPGLNYG